MVQNDSKILINLITTKEDFRQFIKSCLHDEEHNKEVEGNQVKKDDELLTVNQLSTYFQVSTTTIHNWKNEGILPYVKVKSRVRFRKSVVLGFDKKRRNKK